MRNKLTFIFSFIVFIGFAQVKVSENVQKMFSQIQGSKLSPKFKTIASKALNAVMCEVYDPWTGECVIPGKESKLQPEEILRGRKDALWAFDRMFTKLQSRSKATQSLNRRAPKVSRDSKHFLMDMKKRLEFFADAKNFGVPVATGRGPK